MELVQIRGLTKSFGGRIVLDAVDLDIAAGEFVALLGPNGAGKSTLIKILDGVYKADRGVVVLPGGPSTASARPIGVVHQDLGLVDDLSVFDNLRLTAAPVRRRGGCLDRPRELEDARRTLAAFDLDFSLFAQVQHLAPVDRALLAVARLAASSPRLIVLDEVTSMLSSADASLLIARLQERASPEVSFMMVTHKLVEAMDLATRIVVLRDGAVVCDRKVPLPSLDEVTTLLSPGLANVGTRSVRSRSEPAETMLTFDAVTKGDIGPLSFAVRRGEVVSITGRAGSNIHDVAYLALGVEAPDTGSVQLAPGARQAIVPPERTTQGNLADLSILWNLTVSSLGRWRRRSGSLRLGDELRDGREVLRSLQVVPFDTNARQGVLSGGNQQKVLFGRALLSEADLFILCEPTRGVDIGTRREIYRLMQELKDEGRALLVIASDPEDVLAVADRVLVLGDGQVVGDYDATNLTVAELANVV